MKTSPWFQQKRSESAPPVQRPKDPPSMSIKEQDEITDRISRPTESALYRQSLYWKLDSFMDRGFHSWSKMDLFDDCKRCMWTPQGSIKGSCKIRPLYTSASCNLPPLRSSCKDGTWRTKMADCNSARRSLESREKSNVSGSASSRRPCGDVSSVVSLRRHPPGMAMLSGTAAIPSRNHSQRVARISTRHYHPAFATPGVAVPSSSELRIRAP